MSTARALAGLFPGARLSPAGNAFNLIFEVDGCWLDARVLDTSRTEIFIRTLDVPGFEATIRPRPDVIPFETVLSLGPFGLGVPSVGAVEAGVEAEQARLSFTRHWRTAHRDDAMTALWLDEPARQTITDSTWLVPVTGDVLIAGVHVGGYHFHVAGGQVLVTRRVTTDLRHLHAAVVAGGMLAARPHRLARAWLEVARDLGGTTTADRWDLGGTFAATVERGATTVRFDNVRALPGEGAARRLRTRLRARRVSTDADRWAMWSGDVGRGFRPQVGRRLRGVDLPPALAGWRAEASDPERLRARLAAVAGPLAEAAPAAAWAHGDELGMWWDGVLLDRARLGPAAEVAARLAVDLAAPTGPYR